MWKEFPLCKRAAVLESRVSRLDLPAQGKCLAVPRGWALGPNCPGSSPICASCRILSCKSGGLLGRAEMGGPSSLGSEV